MHHNFNSNIKFKVSSCVNGQFAVDNIKIFFFFIFTKNVYAPLCDLVFWPKHRSTKESKGIRQRPIN